MWRSAVQLCQSLQGRPTRPAFFFWGYSSAGRAHALQAWGRRFESDYLHPMRLTLSSRPLFLFSRPAPSPLSVSCRPPSTKTAFLVDEPPFCAVATETPASMLMAGLSLREWRFCTLFAKGYGKNTFHGQVSGTDEGAGPGSGPERAGIPAGDAVGFGLFCSGCPDRQGADSCTEG